MPRVAREAELRTLTECEYRCPGETLSDLQMVRSLFSDLRLYVDYYCFPNKEKKKLVYLAGTLPVSYDGSEYNIPVCIWLHETHPASRPRCFVCPSVSMVINPSCCCVDASGNISLDALSTWTQGVSNLLLLVSEMRLVFQKDPPLYARSPANATHPAPATPPAGVPVSGQKASQWEQSSETRRSYTEELLGIDFSSSSSSSSNNPFLSSSSSESSDPLSSRMGALTLRAGSPVRIVQSGAASDRQMTVQSGAASDRQMTVQSGAASDRQMTVQSGAASDRQMTVQSGAASDRQMTAARADLMKMAAGLPPDKAAIFLSLVTLEGRGFSPDDVMEAVRLSRDFPSALRFLSHCCPLCQDQVSFSKIITMTHCSCFLCETCFKAFFSAAIKERSIDQLVCPQCGRPEVKGHTGMEYFNLLDTQIRHFLSPEIHELFQRKLRDRALQEMPNFRWCAHCSFGMLHEADRLRMDCPSCNKSTCCQCRSAWSPEHQGVSCQQFRVWQQQNHPDLQNLLSSSSIECPECQSVFSLSRGGCLHFTCSQCQHQFCGGCSQPFYPGSACSFSADCGSKGLHAHHPRDCLYHLRDWSVSRLHLLLQYYRVSPSWVEAANGSSAHISQTVCLILELRDDGSRSEEPCGRPAPPEYRGHCQVHYKERLVELINRCRADPAVLFSVAEMKAELQRWNTAMPTRKPEEPEPLYAHRLRMTLTNSVPLRKQRRSDI
ncbi:E3 ubiquitin-protein ligase RNF31 isoform X2 [Sander lucioperca]|uniref:E3 ubiquitin-protein ligase RNF31 isoform X2 n=1 Tax=Sander lucioperca TaxID=283035 RepID=UPI00125CD52C|nr:E3 ubiquitin-protein ligase RNF31 isoform X2 [Sander lucioperca]